MRESEVREPGLRECWKAVLVMVFLAACGFGIFLNHDYQARKEVRKQHVALVTKQKVETAKFAKISAAKVAKIGKIKRKKGYKMEKIVLGNTKTLVVDSFSFSSGDTFPSPNDTVGAYRIGGGPTKNGVATVSGMKATWTPFDDSGDPGSVSVDVFVPVDPSLIGVQTLTINSTDSNDDSMVWKGSVEFEVVCMTVTLTANNWTADPE